MTINDQDWNFLNVPSEGVGALQNIGNKDIKLVFTGAKKNAYSDVNNCILENNLKTNFEILGFVSEDEMLNLYFQAKCVIFASGCASTYIPSIEAINVS